MDFDAFGWARKQNTGGGNVAGVTPKIRKRRAFTAGKTGGGTRGVAVFVSGYVVFWLPLSLGRKYTLKGRFEHIWRVSQGYS